MKTKIISILALLCAVAQGAWADEWATVYTQTQTTSGNWTALNASSTTGRTLGSADATTYYYASGNLSFTNSTAGGSGLTIIGTVYLYVPEGRTITCIGANANGQTGAGAGIELTADNTLYLIGSGSLTATGGNAANGGNGGNGSDAECTYDVSILGGSGGTGGYGGGGAGAGIGTRGANGGTGGGGGQRNGSYGQETTQYGVDGSAGSAGGTAAAMGAIYVFQSSVTLNATGGSAGSSGSGGSRGKTASQHPGSNVYMASGGGGGGAGGYGGAASNIGTGGPGGGGGGGGAAGNVAWVVYSGTLNGYYHAGAYGGHGGNNGDGSSAPNGADVELDNPRHADIQAGGLRPSASDYTDDASWENGNGRHAGGSGGARGNASTSGSASTVSVDWTTQENDWGLICLQTGSTRADWVHLADNASTGKTLGAVGTTTYYYTAADRTFTNSNAGGSGLTILGTVYLYIPSGKTITCTGAHASGTTGAGAGIELTEGNTLYLIGSGSLTATGGNAANGGNGGNGGDGGHDFSDWVWSGAGGRGGDGGGGAGAGIGSRGANGGAGGAGGAGIQEEYWACPPTTGNVGSNGQNGGTAAAMGTLYIYDGSQALTPQTDIHGGSQGTSSGNRSEGGRHAIVDDGGPTWMRTMGGGGGGAGGGFGGAASNIGTGGPGGGGGGGGASGSIDKDGIDQTPPIHYDYYKVGAFGGRPGANGDGTTTAGYGGNTEMNNTDNMSQMNTDLVPLVNVGWRDGVDHRAAGGSGGSRGSASTSGSSIPVAVAWPTLGAGTEDAPFIVNSTEDWNGFANAVTGGCTFSGQFVKLNADISVSTMAGADDANSFQGTFDGDGHTLTFTKGTSESPFGETYCAPLRHVKNAVIKNLHVDGTIYTSVQKAAGLVGESHGALSITGCRSSININSSRSGDGTHGGFVATLSGSGNTILIDGCVFDGSFATTNSTTNCGGFIGWPVYNRPVIKNSLMKPSSVAAGMLINTFCRWHTTYKPTITNCYFITTTNLPVNQGMNPVISDAAPANLGSLVQDYGMVKAYQNGILYDGKYYAAFVISLANDDDNSTIISNANGYGANVTLANRTLYKDGDWNTICLPFNVDLTADGCPLAGAVARPLTSASISGSTLNLTFGGAVTTLVAGTPYIIKWESGANLTEANLVFNGVTIDATDRSYDNGEGGEEQVRFKGTYASMEFDATDNSILLMGGENKLYYPSNGAGLGAQRAYFKIGSDAQHAPMRVTSFSISFGDGGTTTGVIAVDASELKNNDSDAWYNIYGIKLEGKPTQKGLYINNGIKVVIE